MNKKINILIGYDTIDLKFNGTLKKSLEKFDLTIVFFLENQFSSESNNDNFNTVRDILLDEIEDVVDYSDFYISPMLLNSNNTLNLNEKISKIIRMNGLHPKKVEVSLDFKDLAIEKNFVI